MLKHMSILKTKQKILHTWERRGFKGYLLISTRPFRTNTKKRCPCQPRGVECKTRSQEIPGVTGKYALEYKIKQGKGSQSFVKRTHWL